LREGEWCVDGGEGSSGAGECVRSVAAHGDTKTGDIEVSGDETGDDPRLDDGDDGGGVEEADDADADAADADDDNDDGSDLETRTTGAAASHSEKSRSADADAEVLRDRNGGRPLL
jgi:hypothetical protein